MKIKKSIIIKYDGRVKQANFSGTMKFNNFVTLFEKMFGVNLLQFSGVFVRDLENKASIDISSFLHKINSSSSMLKFEVSLNSQLAPPGQHPYSSMPLGAISIMDINNSNLNPAEILQFVTEVPSKRRVTLATNELEDTVQKLNSLVVPPQNLSEMEFLELPEDKNQADKLLSKYDTVVLFNTNNIEKCKRVVDGIINKSTNSFLLAYRLVDNSFLESVYFFYKNLIMFSLEVNDNLKANISSFLAQQNPSAFVPKDEADDRQDNIAASSFNDIMKMLFSKELMTLEEIDDVRIAYNFQPVFIKYIIEQFEKGLIDLDGLA